MEWAETTSDDRQTTWTSTGRAVGLIRNVRSSNEEELKLSRLILDSAFVCSHGQSSLLIPFGTTYEALLGKGASCQNFV
ncbi:uncharacterized protein BDCG_03494 [Blastomyces dermatitidis ER-3]|uniref:Uncharacterized protein n=1 Tax=Ajellomyces dermatitidis (strain ER-3 / ATCC MYA-2586) TaxID=559297 RepID=A0ABP2EWE9_AJEDR|nr:uncharacterized protein BDCG_03494 [Blastomyces dermatitidis ER-3]EEQ88374.2 hypothetical protein BDCG_03494 [Blastomyces dermatitidis ER-3]